MGEKGVDYFHSSLPEDSGTLLGLYGGSDGRSVPFRSVADWI